MTDAPERDRAAFERLVALIDYPMFVVTAADDDVRAGCLVGFATQVSIDPPRFLVCLSRQNHTFRVAQAGGQWLGVHFLRREDEELGALFGGATGDEVDKFASCAWEPGPAGVPILSACQNWFVGAVVDRLDLGDHEGFVLEPSRARQEAAGPDFSFHRARRIEPGHQA